MKPLYLLLFVLLCSFTAAPEGSFRNSGVSFSIPDGWKITEQEDLEGKGYYLACEKEGDNSSGLVTVTWVNDSIDLTEMIQSFSDGLKENYILKNARPEMQPVAKTSFNGMDAIGLKYTLELLGVPHEGRLYCFYGKDKTVTVMVQEALEDQAENRAGLQVITSSFSAR